VDLLEAPPDLPLFFDLRAVLAGRLGNGDVDVDIRELAEELVERRIDEPDHDGQAVHGLVHLAEVALLEREELRERGLPALQGVGHDHVLHERQALGLPEHVLGAREAHTLRAQLAGLDALTRRVGVHPHPEPAALVGP